MASQRRSVSGGGEDGVGVIAVASLEIVAVHAVLGLDMADDGFDGGAALHLAFDGRGCAAHLAGDPDPEFVRMVVAAIAAVDMAAFDLDTSHLLDAGEGGVECMAVERVAMQRPGVEH